MHELGIVFYIIRDVKKAAQENGVEHVSTVVMNIGEVSTIVPEYLTDCWRWAADKEDMLRGCELKIDPIPAITHCDGCGKTTPPSRTARSVPIAAAKTHGSSAATKWRSRRLSFRKMTK